VVTIHSNFAMMMMMMLNIFHFHFSRLVHAHFCPRIFLAYFLLSSFMSTATGYSFIQTWLMCDEYCHFPERKKQI